MQRLKLLLKKEKRTMKRLFVLFLLLVVGVEATLACTNLIVGKKASTDGSVMCTYNCDGFGFSGSLSYSPSGRHEPGELIEIHGWGPSHKGQYVKQVNTPIISSA